MILTPFFRLRFDDKADELVLEISPDQARARQITIRKGEAAVAGDEKTEATKGSPSVVADLDGKGYVLAIRVNMAAELLKALGEV